MTPGQITRAKVDALMCLAMMITRSANLTNKMLAGLLPHVDYDTAHEQFNEMDRLAMTIHSPMTQHRARQIAKGELETIAVNLAAMDTGTALALKNWRNSYV